jgi:hypothetical protein
MCIVLPKFTLIYLYCIIYHNIKGHFHLKFTASYACDSCTWTFSKIQSPLRQISLYSFFICLVIFIKSGSAYGVNFILFIDVKYPFGFYVCMYVLRPTAHSPCG